MIRYFHTVSRTDSHRVFKVDGEEVTCIGHDSQFYSFANQAKGWLEHLRKMSKKYPNEYQITEVSESEVPALAFDIKMAEIQHESENSVIVFAAGQYFYLQPDDMDDKEEAKYLAYGVIDKIVKVDDVEMLVKCLGRILGIWMDADPALPIEECVTLSHGGKALKCAGDLKPFDPARVYEIDGMVARAHPDHLAMARRGNADPSLDGNWVHAPFEDLDSKIIGSTDSDHDHFKRR